MLAEAMTNVSSRFALRRGWPSQPARHTPINAIMMHPATCVCRSDDRSCLNFALAFGRVAQPDRASGFEAEGCRFKSCLGHQHVARGDRKPGLRRVGLRGRETGMHPVTSCQAPVL